MTEVAKCPKHPDADCAEGRSRCGACLETLKEYQRKRRAERKGAGKCVGTVGRSRCDSPPRPGKTMCEECARVFNEYQKRKLRERRERRGQKA